MQKKKKLKCGFTKHLSDIQKYIHEGIILNKLALYPHVILNITIKKPNYFQYLVKNTSKNVFLKRYLI